jgi:rRNA maturation endonuclease Nob1
MNMECTDCGKEYYSAFPQVAEEKTICDNCGTFTVRVKE